MRKFEMDGREKWNNKNYQEKEVRILTSYHEKGYVFVTEAYYAREDNGNKKFRKKTDIFTKNLRKWYGSNSNDLFRAAIWSENCYDDFQSLLGDGT